MEPTGNEPASSRPERALTAGVRRLTAAEYDRVVGDLLGLDARATETWPPETRQNGFTRNAAQAADAVFAGILHDQAARLADQAVSERLAVLLPCAESEADSCADQLIRELGARAFRRPLSSDEIARYRGLFQVGRETSDFRGAVQLVLATFLQSPSLLYATELGAGAGAFSPLTEYEIASLLAFDVAGLPPDAELLASAARGELLRPAVRERAARRLLGQSAARHHYRRFVGEWLELDRLHTLAKDPLLYPEFPRLRALFQAESETFVDRIMIEQQAALSALLALEPGVRPGILQRPAFLATHAHESNSGPVLRGVAVLRRVLCRTLPDPGELGIEVVPPPPDPSSTTRQRFSSHAAEPVCAACHAEIDAVGFSFENFDAVGEVRELEVGRPVDTRGRIRLGAAEIELRDSADLSRALASDPEAASCLSRQVFRYMTGRSEPELEQAFVAVAGELEPEARGNVLELVVAYVRSDAFVWRRHEP